MASTVQSAAPPSDPVQAPRPPHGNSARWLIAGSIALAVIVALLFAYSRGTATPQYLTARVDRGDIDSTVTTSGNLNAVITVQVGSQVSGNIIALYADFNTKVTKGQLVAEIDPAPFKAAVDQSRAVLAAAKAASVTAQAAVVAQQANLAKTQSAVNLARVENDRRQVMLVTGSTSQEDADTAKANYEQAAANVDAAKAAINSAQAAAESARKAIDVARNQLAQTRAIVAQDDAALAQAQLNLDHTRIIAPVDGVVESRNMDVGQTVAASFQAPTIFLIAQDLTKMQVDTNVDEADVGPIRTGQDAVFTVDAYPGQVFHARVAQIRKAPINVQNVITYDVVVEVSNPDLKLFPGMTANVTIFNGHASNVLRLPKAALRFRPRGAANPNAAAVYIVGKQGEPVAIPVKTGIADANRIELVSGNLAEGAAVITGNKARQGESAPAQSGAGKKLGF
jgi:HlyD family secretion protein